MKTSKSLIFIALLSVFVLLAVACTGNTGNIPQPSGSDTLPSGTASDTGSSITGTPPTEETPAGTEAPVTGDRSVERYCRRCDHCSRIDLH